MGRPRPNVPQRCVRAAPGNIDGPRATRLLGPPVPREQSRSPTFTCPDTSLGALTAVLTAIPGAAPQAGVRHPAHALLTGERPVPAKPVLWPRTRSNCVVARRGGEQQKRTNQTVTRVNTIRRENRDELASARPWREPGAMAKSWRGMPRGEQGQIPRQSPVLARPHVFGDGMEGKGVRRENGRAADAGGHRTVSSSQSRRSSHEAGQPRRSQGRQESESA